MLRVKFWRIENVVCAKVLEQDSVNFELFISNDGFKIHSIACPEMTTKTLFVRGSNTIRDNVVFCRSFGDCDEARNYIAIATTAIAEFNAVRKDKRCTTDD
jgi:hypothetical protein